MQVKILKAISGPLFDFRPDDVVEVSEREGARWIKRGIVESYGAAKETAGGLPLRDDEPEGELELESAVQAERETTSTRKRRAGGAR